jgi:tetraacyldisaccharide 4'-kinase
VTHVIRNKLIHVWYQERPSLLSRLLYPFSLLFRVVTVARRLCYRFHLLRSQSFSAPVIVVGNITVGGTGKTPMVIHLVELLTAHGYHPGVVSRGYGGTATHATLVTENSDAKQIGDEALLIARQTRAPVVVAKKRCQAVKKLLAEKQCDVIISDDGLQHYAMVRDVEVAMLDGKRRLGNMHMLPAGPLREPIDRLREVDALVITEGEAFNDEYAMTLAPADYLIAVTDPSKTLAVSTLTEQSVHAVAGIAHPERFFVTLNALGVKAERHVFPDHYAYTAKDLNFADDKPVIMTEKDAVKCRPFAGQNVWYLPVKAKLSSTFNEFMLKRLAEMPALKRN